MHNVVLLMSSGAGYERGILRGIARYARHHGPWRFLLAGDQPGLPRPMRYSETPLSTAADARRNRGGFSTFDLRKFGATGFIGRLYTPKITEAVLASGVPAIAMDLTDEQLASRGPLGRVSELRPDSDQAGRLAAEHLLAAGFHRFAFCGYPGENWSRRRQEGFCRRLREAGFDCDVFPLSRRRVRTPWRREQPKMTAWLASLPKPLGVMACNDERARQAIDACAMGGLPVPEEVAVIGCDEDHILEELAHLPISSVAFDAEQGGYRAAELLDAMMSGRRRPRQTIVVDALWAVGRRSTDAIAVADRRVADAVRFIRENARQAIGVADVVRHSTLSRRALEIRFHGSMGRSMREEIQRVRLEWVKQLIVETDLPMSKIADCTGFRGESYLCKVFRRLMDTTPGQYRRDHRLA